MEAKTRLFIGKVRGFSLGIPGYIAGPSTVPFEFVNLKEMLIAAKDAVKARQEVIGSGLEYVGEEWNPGLRRPRASSTLEGPPIEDSELDLPPAYQWRPGYGMAASEAIVSRRARMLSDGR